MPIEGLTASEPVSGILSTNLDSDGRTDLVAPSPSGRVHAWRNTSERTKSEKTRIVFETWPINATAWRAAQSIDLDLDGRGDLLGLPSSSGRPGAGRFASWVRNEGTRFSETTLTLAVQTPEPEGLAAVDLIGDPLPDLLLVQPGEPPALAKNLGNGRHWVTLQLGGHWHVKPELMRTNSHAIGTRVTLEGQGIYVCYDHTTPESGLSQSITPVVLGLGDRERADLVHLRWPDGVLQCELNQVADQKIDLFENNRKTGSCPVLFTWNGRRFVCIGDFLGGGGLGYLVAPGLYSQPDRDEAIAITAEQLASIDGVFRLSITEPMDELAYLDHLSLDVVDRPPGVSSTPDERFVPEGPRASGQLRAWRTAVEPARATDLSGHDVTERLRHWDRLTVDGFARREGWIGYAMPHGVILDFGDRLSRYGPSDALVLCLAGWVEYPYSQTNYAAATAGCPLEPPAIERRRDDGQWETIEPHAGYPAGMPRLMTIDLTGKLAGPRCELRIKTNMECYYDQAFIAVRDREAEASLRVTKLPVARAVLGLRGYTREISPDGRLPLIYDYDYVDPAPLARFSGKLTRHGDVARLLQADDDQLCLVGPGDEVRLEFEAGGLEPLPPGWTRSYVLRPSGTARTPIRSRPRAIPSSRYRGAACRHFRSAPIPSGHPIPPTRSIFDFFRRARLVAAAEKTSAHLAGRHLLDCHGAGVRGGVIGVRASAIIRGRLRTKLRIIQRTRIQATIAPTSKIGTQTAQLTAQSTMDLPRLTRPRIELSHTLAICVEKLATTGAGGAYFSRSRTFRVKVARDERFSSRRILPSSCSISPRTRLNSTSIFNTSSSFPERSWRILLSVCSSTFLFLMRASMS